MSASFRSDLSYLASWRERGERWRLFSSLSLTVSFLLSLFAPFSFLSFAFLAPFPSSAPSAFLTISKLNLDFVSFLLSSSLSLSLSSLFHSFFLAHLYPFLFFSLLLPLSPPLSSLPSGPRGRCYHSCVTHEDSLYIFGGNSNGILNDLSVYHIGKDRWTPIEGKRSYYLSPLFPLSFTLPPRLLPPSLLPLSHPSLPLSPKSQVTSLALASVTLP